MISDFARRLKSGLKRGVGRVSADQRGNVLMLTAAALVPLIGIIGSGIDIGRSYMTQLRLQQACDAGVLAGRRSMGGGDYTSSAQQDALRMFRFNFPNGMYGSSFANFSSQRTPGSDVVGAATAVIPTSIMHIFGFEEFNLAVECGAKLEIANTDVMMVLDVTSSMTLDSGDKLGGLKVASKNFVDALTSADVGDGRVRLGMVPYSLTVNVGDVILAKNRNWISNQLVIPSISYRRTGTSSNNYKYYYDLSNRIFDVSTLNSRVGNTKSFNIGKQGGNVNVKWEGCLVEGRTSPFTAAIPPSSAVDLDIDFKPSNSADSSISPDTSKWGLYLPAMAYVRPRGTTTHSITVNSTANLPVSPVGSYSSGCVTSKVEKLATINASNKSSFKGKIDLLKTHGYTYHDVGMIWGGRLISPDGIFGDENADETSPNGKPISRHILFMTDGKMDTAWGDYSHQSIELNLGRIGTNAGAAWNSSRLRDNPDSNDRHVKRFEYICSEIKKKGIKIWVVAFGFPSGQTVTNNDDLKSLNKCANEDAMYMASNNSALNDVFVSIAGQISRLRVSE